MPFRSLRDANFVHRLRLHAHLPERLRFHLRTRARRETFSSSISLADRVPRPPGNSFEYVTFEDVDSTIPELDGSRPLTPTAEDFLRNLQAIPVMSLPEDGRSCRICHESYCHGDEPEAPVKLPCGHDFGRVCIERWLSPDQAQPKNNCPLCRTEFFTLEPSIDYDSDEESFDEDWDRIRLSRILRTQEEHAFDTWNYSRFPMSAEEATYQMQMFDQQWEDQMQLFTYRRRFVPRLDPRARTASQILQSFQENPLPSHREAVALGAEMGQLFIRLRTTMRLLKFLPAFAEYGPPPHHLMYTAPRHVVETALLRLIPVEEAYIWAQQGV